MINIPEIFASMVFGDAAMREKLSKDTYKRLKQTIAEGKHLDITLANEVAHGMKEWALEKGATHYTHWFQPMTGVTAEKHDSFITPAGPDKVIMEFSGKELIKGEPDASSFPSGGLRATFEARGYTSWDPTSYAFVKDGTLCIPTAFCSYNGEALDKKTPLLRSMQTLETQAKRVLKFFGEDDVRITASVGPEQEYFLVDKSVYLKRPDLIYTGRTLLGARPPKGQEMEDHYFGALKPRISAFMKELDEELWKLGIYAKTKHNEAAPSQHELAPVFTTANVATDHNQLTMELMKRIADRHGMVCLLHEKPFAGVNGSGKHNNWSIDTPAGSLLKPGKTPAQNARFLIFFAAVIKAVDEYQDMLRVSVASAGNDHRLGGSEAPPAIMSIYIGEDLTEVLDSIVKKEDHNCADSMELETGVGFLPQFKKDTTDRNRTSPFAFTGNRFEFRMPGSSLSIAGINTILNTIVAEELSIIADRLEKTDDIKREIFHIVRKTVRENSRIIFNGNNYSEEWVEEAQRRGLLNLKTTPEALPYMLSDKNISLFERHGVFTKEELKSRYEILMENYCKTVHIEALALIDMVKKDVLPSILGYEKDVAQIAGDKKTIGAGIDLELKLINKMSDLTSLMYERVEGLERAVEETSLCGDITEKGTLTRDRILSSMQGVREVADELETVVGKKYWPFPTYGEMLYSVQ